MQMVGQVGGMLGGMLGGRSGGRSGGGSEGMHPGQSLGGGVDVVGFVESMGQMMDEKTALNIPRGWILPRQVYRSGM